MEGRGKQRRRAEGRANEVPDRKPSSRRVISFHNNFAKSYEGVSISSGFESFCVCKNVSPPPPHVYNFVVLLFVIEFGTVALYCIDMITNLMKRDFCAIDFETACHSRASACAVGMVRVRSGEIAETFYSLIKPPAGMEIWPSFTAIHGITMHDVRDAPAFNELWSRINEFIQGDLLVAHNAAFDRGVLKGCLEYYDIDHECPRFECTVNHSRRAWEKELQTMRLVNCKLNTLSEFLGIELKHHVALSDAIACAKIFLAAQR